MPRGIVIVMHIIFGALISVITFLFLGAILGLFFGPVGVYVLAWIIPILWILAGATAAWKGRWRYQAIGWTLSSSAILGYVILTWN